MESILDEYNYFVVFYEDIPDGMMVYHLIGYVNEPSEVDILYNQKEMIDDPDFGIGEKAKTLKVKVVDNKTARKILEGEN